MDRATGLEALAEEEDEEYGISDDSISDDDEQGDGGIRKGEPNKFDALCDGVLNATALVHATLSELLDLKDELLKHALPPNVLMKIALCTTKVFRGVSDMSSPVNELLRMVRLYSTPWEEKSAALKKLHEDYNSKKDQLNIAVKRLQLIDAHSRRIAKERRILNWEKLFSKLTSTRGHGRRWKFLIEPFKRKVNESPEALQAYVDEMEHDSDQSDDEDDKEVDTQMQHMIPSPSEEPASIEPNQEESDNDETEVDSDMKDSEIESIDSRQKADKDVVPAYIRPPMKDKECWTHEPQYKKYLHLRVYKPEGLEYRELRCYITYGKIIHKTTILDPLPPEEKKEEQELTASSRGGRPIRGRGRGRGVNRGGKSAGRPGAAKGSQLLHPQEQAKEEKKEGPFYEEVMFNIPEEIKQLLRPKSRKSSSDISETEPDHLKIAVHYGPKEEMVAMATIEKEDLDSLDLPVVDMRPPEGDKFPDEREEYVPTPGPRITPSDSGTDKDAFDPEKVLKDIQPVNFPLYSIHAGKSDAMHMPVGQLPLVCFWARQLQPHKFDRATDSETVRDIVYDTTGFDIDVVTKADLHKEVREECLSAMSFVSQPKEDEEESEQQETKAEETVPRSHYDKQMQIHRDEMESLQEDYEQKLQDLVEQFQQIQEAMMEAQSASNSPHMMMMMQENMKQNGERQVMSPAISIPAQSRPKRSKTQPPPSEYFPKKNFAVGKPLPVWGENLPKDFFERLKVFEEESKKHQQENIEKTTKEMREMLEKKFAAEFKLSNNTGNEQFNPMEDVCLPAVFMPSGTSSKAAVYNPRAAKYFHPTGAGGVRLTQPPSMVQLPPIPKNKLSVVNLFDVAQNFQRGGNQWLMDKYLQAQPREKSAQPRTPIQTFASTNFPDSLQQSAIHEANGVTVGSSPMKEAMLD